MVRTILRVYGVGKLLQSPHEIRHRHPRRLLPTSRSDARRQDAAAGRAHAEHGPHRQARRRRPVEQRARSRSRRRSDVATLSLFGYDPLEVYTGRAPLETAAMGIHARPERLGHPLQPRPRRRRPDAGLHRRAHLQRGRRDRSIEAAASRSLGGQDSRRRRRLEFHPGVSTATSSSAAARRRPPFGDDTKTQPPHDIPDKPVADHLPQGPGGDVAA